MLPLIVQLLIQPTTSQVAFILLDAPAIVKSWLPPVAVEAAPCVQTRTLLSPPLDVQSKSDPATSPVPPTAKVAVALSPVFEYVQLELLPCNKLATILLLSPI